MLSLFSQTREAEYKMEYMKYIGCTVAGMFIGGALTIKLIERYKPNHPDYDHINPLVKTIFNYSEQQLIDSIKRYETVDVKYQGGEKKYTTFKLIRNRGLDVTCTEVDNILDADKLLSEQGLKKYLIKHEGLHDEILCIKYRKV